MWCKILLSLFVASRIECLPKSVSVIRTPNDQNSISGVNFIYFLGPTPYQMRAAEHISNNYLTELVRDNDENPLLNTLLLPRKKEHEEISNLNKRHSHSNRGSFRSKRNADPSYKKGYRSGGGGGGGCCNSCGQCGGGNSGSYSQSQSYSSSSSGSYSSGHGKK